jgi:hypothetical protein
MPDKEPNATEVFRQFTEILQKTLSRITEVEQHISKDLESIRRQLDAVGVLKENIANLNNRIDTLSKRLAELSRQEPQELSRLMIRAISELDKRMQMFTITEVLSRLESGALGVSPRIASTPVVAKPTPKAASPAPASSPTSKAKTPASTAASSESVDAVAEPTGADAPWRERMREKYGLKKKPGSLM